MRRHFEEIATLSGGTFRTEVHDIVANDAHAVALLQASAERGTLVVDLPKVALSGSYRDRWTSCPRHSMNRVLDAVPYHSVALRSLEHRWNVRFIRVSDSPPHRSPSR
jgi:hypothetical protein